MAEIRKKDACDECFKACVDVAVFCKWFTDDDGDDYQEDFCICSCCLMLALAKLEPR